jgi:hypothetical protein
VAGVDGEHDDQYSALLVLLGPASIGTWQQLSFLNETRIARRWP